MRKYILDLFNIKEDESGRVFLLLIQSVFLGTFYGAFDIGASALFLDAYPSEMIPKAFLISGIAGIIMTSTYSYFHNRIVFSRLSVITLFVLTVLSGLMWYGYELTNEKWLSFTVFVMLGPLNIVGLLSFWGTVSRLFSLRQGKRLFGLVDTGQVIGIVLSSYAIPVLIAFGFGTTYTLLISTISIACSFLFQIIITRRYTSFVSIKVEKKSKISGEKTSSVKLFKNRYIILMTLFVGLSMISAFFVFNSFLAVTQLKYPNSSDLAQFLGFFIGTLMIFSLIIKTFVYGALMKTYGLKISLVLSAVVLGLLTILAALAGSFGYEVTDKSFMLFFLLIVLSRLFSVSLKTSIEGPSFKLLYQSLDREIRYDVQAKMDGMVNEFSALFSGIILTALASISFIHLLHFTYALVIILFIWAIVAYRLYAGYRKSLEKSLEKSKTSEAEVLQPDLDSLLTIRHQIQTGNPGQTDAALIILSFTDPLEYEKTVIEILESNTPAKKIASRHLKNIGIFDSMVLEKFLKNESDPEIKLHLEQKIKLIQDLHVKYKGQVFTELIKSKDINDKLYILNYLRFFGDESHVRLLVELIRDIDPKIRCEAIKTASKLHNPEIIGLITDNLLNIKLLNISLSALKAIGEASLEALEQSFYKTDINPHIQVQIIRTMGLIRGPKAIKYLINKLTSENQNVLTQTVLSLRMCNFSADEKNMAKILQVIEKNLAKMAWLLAIQASHENNFISREVEQGITEEMSKSNEFLMHLLSLAYDASSIAHVKENLEAESAESTGFAIELLDMFVHEELKPKLFPLLEDIPVLEKIKQLESHFAIKIFTAEELSREILNLNYSNRFTKASILDGIKNMQDIALSPDILAHLFNPDKMLRELAAETAFAKDREEFEKTLNRLDRTQKAELEKHVYKPTKTNSGSIYNKVSLLGKMAGFETLSGSDRVEISEILINPAMNEDGKMILESHLAFVFEGTMEINNEPLSTPGFKLQATKAMEIFSPDNADIYITDPNHFSLLVCENQKLTTCLLNILEYSEQNKNFKNGTDN